MRILIIYCQFFVRLRTPVKRRSLEWTIAGEFPAASRFARKKFVEMAIARRLVPSVSRNTVQPMNNSTTIRATQYLEDSEFFCKM